MNIFWFRRDLRLIDNHALSQSLKNNYTQTIFIFDDFILNPIKNKKDIRVQYIYDSLHSIDCDLKRYHHSSLKIYKGNILECWKKIILDFKIDFVFFNEDYEPYSQKRDIEVLDFLNSIGIKMYCFKDQVIFSPNEILKSDKSPYTIYTPYSKKWKKYLHNVKIPFYDLISNFNVSNFEFPSLESLGFINSIISLPKLKLDKDLIKSYNQNRNFPSLDSTSNLGIYLRFGTVSIRKIVKENQSISETFINELIWREFFMQILYHFPENKSYAFRKKYNKIIWINDETHIECWKSGITGFPMIDAGMRELNQTGRMHNRVRMLVANFLTKHLLVDWKIGENYFAEKLLDFELSSNNGNWQWSTGCGCDAAPYFRIFNPDVQQQKFDSESIYITKWISNINDFTYPKRIIDLKTSRNRAFQFFKKYLS